MGNICGRVLGPQTGRLGACTQNAQLLQTSQSLLVRSSLCSFINVINSYSREALEAVSPSMFVDITVSAVERLWLFTADIVWLEVVRYVGRIRRLFDIVF